jgi:hypothetical protein
MPTKRTIDDSTTNLAAEVGAIYEAKIPPTHLAHLDPATALSEVLFGLIMTLTFTLSAGLIIEDEGRNGARQLLIAVIGCNIAWGIIDGALYLAGELFNRGRLRKLGQAIRNAPSHAAALAHVSTELDPLLTAVLKPSDRDDLYERIVEATETKPHGDVVRVTREDWKGAFTSFWLVLLSSVPAAVPFLLIDNARLALRISNGLLVALLFLTGYWWARYTLGKPWLVGASFLAVGLVLIVAAIALGG